MGRQIQLVSTDEDNAQFETFLKGEFDCVFFQGSAPSESALAIESFRDTSFPFSSQIFIWNKAFSWAPTIEHYPKHNKYVLSSPSNAPLIEFIKTIPGHNDAGRLYWAKHFTHGPIIYDMERFEAFYNTVQRWLIKNAAGKVKGAGTILYFMPLAWKNHVAITQSSG